MRHDYNYDIIYRHPEHNNEQYTFTSCKWFGSAEAAIQNFENEMGFPRECVTDAFRLIKNGKKPINDNVTDPHCLGRAGL